jgi:hypothetical protein
MRLIDADAMKSKLVGSRFHYIRNFLNKQPTIEAEPVRHGRWIVEYPTGSAFGRCSACKTLGNLDWHYCPNCGAKMDGGSHD